MGYIFNLSPRGKTRLRLIEIVCVGKGRICYYKRFYIMIWVNIKYNIIKVGTIMHKKEKKTLEYSNH